MTAYAFEGAKRAATTITYSFATQTYAADAQFPYSSPIPSLYQDAIRTAFAHWASVAGLSFTQSPDSASVAIRVGFGAFASRLTVGQTAYSYAAGLLQPDTIVRLLDPSVVPLALDAQNRWTYGATAITLDQIALHEIGHALGLNHSTDPTTNMYPIATTQNTQLALGDIEGINALYPLYTVAALDPVQIEGDSGAITYHFVITRHSDPATALTINYGVSGAAYPGLAGTVAATASEFAGGAFPSGQITFAAGATTATLAVSVPGDTAAQPDQGFVIALSSAAAGTVATTRGSVNAAILDNDGNASINGNTMGVFRFFSNLDGTHFLTASKNERNTLILTRPDLAYEGINLTAVGNAAIDPAATPVFRFFDTRFGTHFYTTSGSERDATIAARTDLVLEGVGFYEHATAQSGDTLVYRFFDTQHGTHFYTASAPERASVLASRSDLVDEGVGFYAPSAT